MSVRKPPAPKEWNPHWKARPRLGQCCWCDRPLDIRLRKDGQPHGNQPSWHPECLREFKIIYWSSHARQAVWERDRGICAVDGLGYQKVVKPDGYRMDGYEAVVWRPDGGRSGEIVLVPEDLAGEYRQDRAHGMAHRGPGYLFSDVRVHDHPLPPLGAICEVVLVADWHMDHIRPLWSSTHLPPEERIEFFKLDNLQTLGPAAHSRKTTAEAKARAKETRLKRTKSGRRSRSRRGPKLQSRGFRKDVTRKLDGTVVPRERR